MGWNWKPAASCPCGWGVSEVRPWLPWWAYPNLLTASDERGLLEASAGWFRWWVVVLLFLSALCMLAGHQDGPDAANREAGDERTCGGQSEQKESEGCCVLTGVLTLKV